MIIIVEFFIKILMSNKRSGDVTQIDIENGCGVIIDENGQDIHFLLSETSGNISINSRVIFEIVLTRGGLMAVKVVLENELAKI